MQPKTPSGGWHSSPRWRDTWAATRPGPCRRSRYRPKPQASDSEPGRPAEAAWVSCGHTPPPATGWARGSSRGDPSGGRVGQLGWHPTGVDEVRYRKGRRRTASAGRIGCRRRCGSRRGRVIRADPLRSLLNIPKHEGGGIQYRVWKGTSCGSIRRSRWSALRRRRRRRYRRRWGAEMAEGRSGERCGYHHHMGLVSDSGNPVAGLASKSAFWRFLWCLLWWVDSKLGS